MQQVNVVKNFIGIHLVISIMLILPINVSFAETVSFNPATNFAVGGTSVGNSLLAVGSGDFNGDSHKDLAVANGNNNTVSILLGAGDGTFGSPTNLPVGATPLSLNIADFNGDTKLDLAVANGNSNNVSILLGVGDGTFGPPSNLTVNNPSSMATADFNSDGNFDLVVTQSGNHLISILLGNGDGTFGAATSYDLGAFQNPTSVVAADFNSDENLDLAVTNAKGTGISSPDSNIFILLGNGDGTFGAATNRTVGIKPVSLVSGDFNGDGKPDLAVSNVFSLNLSILLSNGDGTFNNAPNVPVGNNPYSLAIGDLNADGLLDLAVTRSGFDDIVVFTSNGDGTFGAAIDFTVQNGPHTLTIEDFNANGLMDLAVTKLSTSNIAILINNTILTPHYAAQIQQPIDLDGSSVFSAKRGVVPVKFILSLDSVSTCSLPAATIAVFQFSDNVNQPIDESIYSMPADNGSNFRINDCQYVYNLSVGSLGPGTYSAQILIDGTPVGSATFGLK